MDSGDKQSHLRFLIAFAASPAIIGIRAFDILDLQPRIAASSPCIPLSRFRAGGCVFPFGASNLQGTYHDMGDVNAVIDKATLAVSRGQSRFAVHYRPGSFVVNYRNLEFEFSADDFLECASSLSRISRESITEFRYSENSFQQLVVLDRNFLRRERNGFSLSHKAGAPGLSYRFLFIQLDATELGLFARFVASRTGEIPDRTEESPSSEPMLGRRFCLELCENVHVHYQDFRLEFSPSEFLLLFDCVASVPLEEWSRAKEGRLCECELPATTEWNDRFQLEEQAQGHYHLHYRNLRIEFRNFSEVDLTIGREPFLVDQEYYRGYILKHRWRLSGVRAHPLRRLKVIVLTENGSKTVPVSESPIYLALMANDPALYEAYFCIVRKRFPQCSGTWPRFQELRRSLQAGQRPRNLIVVKGIRRKKIVDGQHRACLLYHLYGPDEKVWTAHYF